MTTKAVRKTARRSWRATAATLVAITVRRIEMCVNYVAESRDARLPSACLAPCARTRMRTCPNNAAAWHHGQYTESEHRTAMYCRADDPF